MNATQKRYVRGRTKSTLHRKDTNKAARSQRYTKKKQARRHQVNTAQKNTRTRPNQVNATQKDANKATSSQHFAQKRYEQGPHQVSATQKQIRTRPASSRRYTKKMQTRPHQFNDTEKKIRKMPHQINATEKIHEIRKLCITQPSLTRRWGTRTASLCSSFPCSRNSPGCCFPWKAAPSET